MIAICIVGWRVALGVVVDSVVERSVLAVRGIAILAGFAVVVHLHWHQW